MLAELLPLPVFAVGLTGHRDVAANREGAEEIESSISKVLEALQRALGPAFLQEAAFFSPATPILHLITMGAEGAELLGMGAAEKCKIKVSTVFPFAWEDYRDDFSASAAAMAAEIIPRIHSALELPGRRAEGPRAYERANDVILSHIDLLVAVWDGGRAQGRAGTGDVVQAAVAKGIQIIVINPLSPNAPTLLAAAPIDDFELPAASDLARDPLPTDLIGFVHAMISPPPRRAQRQGLVDLIAETPRSLRWRLEYPLLLKTVGGQRLASQKSSPSARKDRAKIVRPAVAPTFSSAPYSDPLKTLDHKRKIIDQLAVQYGQLFRSSSVSQYLIVLLGSWTSGVIGLLVPSLAAASIAVQLVANALVIADAAFRGRHRWQERWLDYRVTAERLRWLGFRYTIGLGAGRQTASVVQKRQSWIAWYLQRTAHALGPPHGRIDSASIAAAADHLLEVEIPDQIDYHRATFRQLGLLERRLFLAAHAALAASLSVAVLLGLATVRAGSLEAVSWKPLALVLLAVLPGTMTSLNGLRVEADLVRLAERSAQTLALLFRVKRIILTAPRDYDHVACNIERLASIMRSELEEWRFVIESRRSRGGRQFTKRRKLLRALTVLQKRLRTSNSRGESLTA